MRGRASAVLLGIAAALAVFALVMTFIGGETVGSDPETSPGSTQNRGADGAYAWAETLRRMGYEVQARERALDDGELPPEGTLVLVDVDNVGQGELDAVAAWVEAGAGRRVVVVGDTDPKVLRRLVPGLDARAPQADGPTQWEGQATVVAVTPAPEALGADELDVADRAGWLAPGDGVAVYARERDVESAYAVRYSLRDGGDVVGVVDDAAVRNEGIAEGDNAGFAQALAGARDTPVVFDQHHHQPARLPGTFGWLPRNVQYLLVQLVVVGVVAAAAAGIRRAPPLPEPDVLPRRRIEFVDALARVYQDSGRDAPALAVAQIRADLRDRLRSALRAGHEVDDLTLADRSAQLGLRPERVAAVLTGVPAQGSDDAALGFPHVAAEAAAIRRFLVDGTVTPANDGVR